MNFGLLFLLSAAPTPAVEEATIAQLSEQMANGNTTSRALVDAYLARIKAIDGKLNSVIELNPDALAIAEERDRERAQEKVRGPLHGIPILIKDNIATHDKMRTTAGSLALEGVIASRDAHVVTKLREAGAVILGKTNLSEWANFRSTRSTSGWSARGGQVHNPYALDRTPSGSSSGSGAAIAANLAAAALGTETDGSITAPSSVCSLVGVKPTLGLVSRAGVIPISHSQDTVGPMARTVADAAILLEVIIGTDPDDVITQAAAEHGGPFSLDPAAIHGARIGVYRKIVDRDRNAARISAAALEELKKLGAVLIDIDIPTAEKVDADELEVLISEFKPDLEAYLARYAPDAKVKTMADLIRFNDEHAGRELKYFGQEIFLDAETRGPRTKKKYLAALARAKRNAGELGIDAVMKKHRLDAIVAPTNVPPSLIDLVDGDYGYLSTTTLPAVAGYPHVTVPAGYVFGLPVGLSFFGAAFSDGKLLSYAYAFERATKHRRPPSLIPTADLR